MRFALMQASVHSKKARRLVGVKQALHRDGRSEWIRPPVTTTSILRRLMKRLRVAGSPFATMRVPLRPTCYRLRTDVGHRASPWRRVGALAHAPHHCARRSHQPLRGLFALDLEWRAAIAW